MLSGGNKGVGPSGHLTDCHESGCKKELLALAKGHEKWNDKYCREHMQGWFLSVLDQTVY